MKYHIYILTMILCCFIFSSDKSAEDVLFKTFHQLDSLDYSFKIKSKSLSKMKKEQSFTIFVYWPKAGPITRKTRITTNNSKHKKPVSFWEYRYRDSASEYWMSLPITGKLKKVKKRKVIKGEFSFEELEMTDSQIFSSINTFESNEIIDEKKHYVIKSLINDTSSSNYKRFWISTDNFKLTRVEFYSSNGRLLRVINCSNYLTHNGKMLPSSIHVQDLKSKDEIQVEITDFKIGSHLDINIFIPEDQ